MKKYAIVIDTSPTEQLVGNDDQVFCLGILMGLKSQKSFDLVGKDFPVEESRLTLRKYAGSNASYKVKVREHLKTLSSTEHVIVTASIVNERYIRRVGLEIWKRAHGPLPEPIDTNKKGKPRQQIGGYRKTDGTLVPPHTVLEDDLVIIGWIASELGLLHGALCQLNKETVALDVLIDRLPNDQGREGVNKAELLKFTIGKLTPQTIDIVGVPQSADVLQRDLVADNIAGLCRELMEKDPIGGRQAIESLLRMTRFVLPTT